MYFFLIFTLNNELGLGKNLKEVLGAVKWEASGQTLDLQLEALQLVLSQHLDKSEVREYLMKRKGAILELGVNSEKAIFCYVRTMSSRDLAGEEASNILQDVLRSELSDSVKIEALKGLRFPLNASEKALETIVERGLHASEAVQIVALETMANDAYIMMRMMEHASFLELLHIVENNYLNHSDPNLRRVSILLIHYFSRNQESFSYEIFRKRVELEKVPIIKDILKRAVLISALRYAGNEPAFFEIALILEIDLFDRLESENPFLRSRSNPISHIRVLNSQFVESITIGKLREAIRLLKQNLINDRVVNVSVGDNTRALMWTFDFHSFLYLLVDVLEKKLTDIESLKGEALSRKLQMTIFILGGVDSLKRRRVIKPAESLEFHAFVTNDVDAKYEELLRGRLKGYEATEADLGIDKESIVKGKEAVLLDFAEDLLRRQGKITEVLSDFDSLLDARSERPIAEEKKSGRDIWIFEKMTGAPISVGTGDLKNKKDPTKKRARRKIRDMKK
ncbi:MAG: hypothetical protein ABIA04_13165 [Pseudomonadota bacterium]